MSAQVPLEPWFDDLPDHPIFTSPPAIHASTSTPTQPSSKQVRKNTFGLADLDGVDDNGSEDEDGTFQVYDESGEEVAQKKDLLIIRGGKEVIVVVGKEIRVADLKEIKEGKSDRYWVSSIESEFPL
jgi:hypothetical protein